MSRRTWRAVAVLLLVLLVPIAAVPAGAQDPPEIFELWLVDADTDTRILRLDDSDVLRLPLLPTRLSVEAVGNEAIESVRMTIDRRTSSVENLRPYALRGDNAGDFNPAPELRIPGWIQVSAQPFSGADLTGAAGFVVGVDLYLQQPDFVVQANDDAGDYSPGDGWCTTGEPPTLDQQVEAVTEDQLTDFEQRRQAWDRERFPDGLNPERTDGLLPTFEVDDEQSSEQTDGFPSEGFLPLVDRVDLDGQAVEFGGSFYDEAEIDFDPELIPWYPNHRCTLRAAIEESNALPGRQTILVDSSNGRFELHHGELEVTDAVEIIGYPDRAVVDARSRSRAVHVTADGLVDLRSVELTRGVPPRVQPFGGGLLVRSEAFVRLRDSVVRDNRANLGGGIYVRDGRLLLQRSAIRDNTAGNPIAFGGGGLTQRGGGLFNDHGDVDIRGSWIYENVAVRGGGLSNFGGMMYLLNTSVLDNEAVSIGGGLENRSSSESTGMLSLAFSTVVGNQAGSSSAPTDSRRVGGGLHNRAITAIGSSIIAGNTDAWSPGDRFHAPDCSTSVSGPIVSYRNNLIGVLNEQCAVVDHTGGAVSPSEFGTETAPLDPGLSGRTSRIFHQRFRYVIRDGLAHDGGAPSGPGPYACPGIDGLGNPRPVGAGCDVGAIENQFS